MNGRKILVAGGMLLVLAGLLYAVVYTLLFSQTLEKTSAINLELALDTAMKGQIEIARAYARELVALGNQRMWHWLVIGHLIGAGLTAMAVSSFLRDLELKKKWERILTYLFIFGGILSASGYFLQILGYSFYGWGLSVTGYVWQLAGIAGFITGLVFHIVVSPGP